VDQSVLLSVFRNGDTASPVPNGVLSVPRDVVWHFSRPERTEFTRVTGRLLELSNLSKQPVWSLYRLSGVKYAVLPLVALGRREKGVCILPLDVDTLTELLDVGTNLHA